MQLRNLLFRGGLLPAVLQLYNKAGGSPPLNHQSIFYDSGANSGSPVCGSSFKLSFNASSATSNCKSSGSLVVTFCNQTPGRVIILKNAPLSFFADKRMISYDSPATTGIRTMRTRKLKSR